MVLVSDGTAADSLGCIALVNGVDVSGKIAVVYRGTCEFGNKALNAQNAGAIGVVVINNAAGTMDMAAGTNGPSVTIPVAMISNANGALLKAQLDANETVRGILGTKRDWINAVSVGTFNHTSGNDNGYAHHVSAGTIELNQDTDHPFIFSPGYQTQAYETQFRVWVDFDLSGDFDDTELVYAQSEPEYGSVSGTFNVPATAPLGSTRMRVLMSYVGPGQTALPTSCSQFSFGEVEDFCVEIMENSGTNSVVEIGDVNIKLFPNPAKDILVISNASDLTVVIEVMDLTGRIIESSQLNPGMNQLNVDRLATGTFICRLTSLNGEVVKTGKLQIAR